MKNNNIAIILNEECKYPSDYRDYLISDIDDIPKNSCDNLYIGDLFDYIDTNNIIDLLKQLIEKIKVEDGLLHIKAPDLLQSCWYTARMNLDINKLRYILYQTNRKNCYSLEEIVSLINSVENTEIVSAFYVNGYEYSITINKYEKQD